MAMLRAVGREEVAALLDAVAQGFLGTRNPTNDERFAAVIDLERTRCAFDGGEIVGTLGAFDLDLAVPGGTLATAGTTIVTVRATHRRRGLLRELMHAHFTEVRERGEALAALWASESSIYDRFGYGCASDMLRIEVDPRRVELVRPAASGSCRMLGAEEAAKQIPAIYESLWRERPGQFARSPQWWENRCLPDDPSMRHGASTFRWVVFEGAGVPSGYAQYRVKERFDESGLADGRLHLVELMASGLEANDALWRHLLSLDLVGRVHAWNLPMDCVLPWLVSEVRQVRRSFRDNLWMRVMDVPRALEARRYTSVGELVLDVRDDFWPDTQGRFRLAAGPEGAHCRACTDPPDLELDVADLGALYLGGRSARAMARAGRLSGSPRALALADALFGWDPAPCCPEVF